MMNTSTLQQNPQNSHHKQRMSLEHAVEAFAGFMVLLSVALTYFVHPAFVWLTVFVGVNLFQQSFTGFCPAAIVMRKVFGLKKECELVRSGSQRF